MVYRATKEIAAAFEAKGIKHELLELSKTSAVKVTFNTKNAPSISIRFSSSDDDSDVSVRIYSLVKVPENKMETMLVKINELNRGYRYARFRIDEDNEVMVTYDLPLATDNLGEMAYEMMVRLVGLADKAYPELMKALWA